MVTHGFTFNLSTERMFGVFFLEVFWFYCNSKDAFCTLLLTLKVFMVKTMIVGNLFSLLSNLFFIVGSLRKGLVPSSTVFTLSNLGLDPIEY